jgi:hypothetical protein
MEGKGPIERPRHKCEDNIQKDFTEIEIKWVD